MREHTLREREQDTHLIFNVYRNNVMGTLDGMEGGMHKSLVQVQNKTLLVPVIRVNIAQ